MSPNCSWPPAGSTVVVRRLLAGLVRFLRAGQPPGAPAAGYSSLPALLRRRVTDDEIADLAPGFAVTGVSSVTVTDTAVAISKVTGDLPSDIDVDCLKAMPARRWLDHA